tara:strand:- start:5084 stop:5419 length:336 start_codon:yes stop_codon:yes gene_type:complete
MANHTFSGDEVLETAAPFGNFRNVNNRYLNLAKHFNGVTLAFHTGFGVSLGAIDWGSIASNFSSVSSILTTTPTNENFTLTDPVTTTRERGWVFGRRPSSGLQYPRGYYNK